MYLLLLVFFSSSASCPTSTHSKIKYSPSPFALEWFNKNKPMMMAMKKSNYNVHSDCTCIGLAHCALRSKRPACTIGDVDDNDNGTRDHSPHCNNSWHVNMPSWLIYMPTSSSSSKLSQPIFFLFTGRHIITTGGGGGTGDANFIFHATLAFWHGMAWHAMHSSPYVIYYLCKILFRPKN